MQTKNFIAETLEQIEPADEFLFCRALLQRWKPVPQHVLLEAVEGGLLVPLRYSNGPGVPRIERVQLPTMADEDGFSSVDMKLAEELGIMFSLANVLLLEHKFPHVFPGQRRKERYSEPMDVIMSLLADKELAQMEAMASHDKYENLARRHMEALSDLHKYERYVDSLQTWVKDLRKATCAGGNIQICDGQAFPQWLCARRRAGVPDDDTMKDLNTKFGFSQASAAFMVKTPTEFNEEIVRAENGSPISDSNRRGTFRSIRDKYNRVRKKKTAEDQQNFAGEDADEDFF